MDTDRSTIQLDISSVNSVSELEPNVGIDDHIKQVMEIESNDIQNQYPLVISNIQKTYNSGGMKVQALKPIYFALKKGEVFGLLGPNGAGKTTLISILTGTTKPDEGEAWIGGYSILDDLPYVYKRIGVCPQFDLLWEDLTVEDHLLFYLRLKGVQSVDENQEVMKACESVLLVPHKQKRVGQLSGGMKRRLSLAISIVGNPEVIFLDEPTTGLDPKNRRQFWAILERVKPGKAIILTTHIMKEADLLSDKIAIIDHGQIKCIGKQAQLKNQYGFGFLFSGVLKHLAYQDESSIYEYSDSVLSQLEDLFEEFKEENVLEKYEKNKVFRYTFTYRVNYDSLILDLLG